MITAILLASGYSRRLNTDKLLLDFHGHPVIAHTLKTIHHCRFDQKLLIQREDRYTHLASQYDFDCLINKSASEGQSAAVRLGVQNSHPDSAYMFFVGDQPCLTADIITLLKHTHLKYPDDIIIPVLNEQYQNPVIFPAAFRPELLAIQGDQGGRSIIKNHPDRIRTVAFQDTLAFRDIDTAADHQFLLEAARYR